MFITVTLSCYRLGGWSFLSAQVCDFCCYLLFVHGKEETTRPFLRHFIRRLMVLPRQARDKHRETTQKQWRFP
jgi:hypothetical protein